MAYASDESGRSEVYVQPFPGPGSRLQISTDGGGQPAWAHNDRELFYRGADRMMAVTIQTEPHLTAGKPRTVFQGHFDFSDYDVSADAARFLMIKGQEEATPKELTVIMNWREELNRPTAEGDQ